MFIAIRKSDAAVLGTPKRSLGELVKELRDRAIPPEIVNLYELEIDSLRRIPESEYTVTTLSFRSVV